MANSDITNLQPEDFHTSVAATSRAFWPDPMFGFFSRNAVHEHLMLPNYATAVMRDAVQHGIVEVIIRNGRVVASASWLAPGSPMATRTSRITAVCAWTPQRTQSSKGTQTSRCDGKEAPEGTTLVFGTIRCRPGVSRQRPWRRVTHSSIRDMRRNSYAGVPRNSETRESSVL